MARSCIQMEEILNSIVIHRKTAEECINRELLDRYTTRIPAPFVKKLRWAKIKHLYILGRASTDDSARPPEAYEDTYRKWVLIVGAEDADIPKYLSRCSSELEKLVVRFTSIEKLNVKRLTGLRNLMLERNHALRQVAGLEPLKELRKLHLTRTAIRNLQLLEPLPNISDFFGNGTLLENADFVQMLPGLNVLNLSKSPISKMPPVSGLSHLKVLKLSDTALTSMNEEDFPEGLASLLLDGTPLHRLPDTIGKLRKLKVLDLSRMTLDCLPAWLPDLEMEFTLDKTGNAIRLSETKVDGVDMSIFAQPRGMILQWFRETNLNGYICNGVKVVLLGDAASEKTMLLQRLLVEGADNQQDFSSQIDSVVRKTFSAYGQRIRTQFWNLDAPELLQSLQPVFLADRTLFMIVLDASNDHAQALAAHWLREVAGCSPDAPVMIVLNRTHRATDFFLDINQLRSIHGNIKHITTMPVKDLSPETFRSEFLRSLLEELLSFPDLMQVIPKAWNDLVQKLDYCPSPLLSLAQYREVCMTCGIDNENIQMNLLQWFMDTGVCFYLDDNSVLGNSVLLQPSWFVNAAAYLLKHAPVGDHKGVISPQDILRCLNMPNIRMRRSADSSEWIVYTEEEAAYILELMRRCNLSLPIDEHWELIPLLCPRKTAKIFYQYRAALNIGNIRLDYAQLPVTVIHKLMLQLGNHLDLNNVWYYGARFQDDVSGNSIVLRKEDQAIQIYTDCPPESAFLADVLSAVRQITAGICLDHNRLPEPEKRNGINMFLQEQMVGEEQLEDPNLNEIRVIFLGDGEAGKSKIIERLLKLRIADDADTPAFTGDATPGIMISHGQYELVGGRRLRLNFWDFGGQEILHSMHRIFVTDQTMCVIVLNARSDTQDDRARYWLRYIKSVSANMPVLLVLNKNDQNINASINENELRRIYPDTTPVIQMSALKDDDRTIRDNLLHALLGKIGLMSALQTQMPANWRKVKEELQTSQNPYIRQKDYEELCRRHGIPDNDETYSKLLNWFNIMGVSYRCDVPGRIASYTILRPEWVTNAAYAILFNKHTDVKNGIVSRRSLDELLKDTKNIQCIDHKRGYTPDEVDYVIQIMRQNNLSYCISSPQAVEHKEFIPMLCQRNESVVVSEYFDDPNVIEFWIRFDYLPDTLMFYLMVDNFSSLDKEHIWLTGARFIDEPTGASAVVKRDENVIKLYVRSDRIYPTPAQYRDTLRTMIGNVVKQHLPGLKILEELVVLKDQDGYETFDYKRLSVNYQKGITHCYSKRNNAPVAIQDILEQTKSAEQERKEQLLTELIKACRKMQEVPQPRGEDPRNKQIMHIISGRLIQGKKLVVLDQSQGGKGKTGINLGERDLMFCTEADTPWIILEALNIDGTGKTATENWRYHLSKLMENYNPYGLKTLILLNYVNKKRNGFTAVWKHYFQEASQYSPEKHSLIPGTVREVIPENVSQANNLKISRGCYGYENAQMEVYHIYVWLETREDETPQNKAK